MRRYIQMVATGPELSKSLTREQAEDGISLILSGEIDPVRAGIFLIALRMKRETDDENIGALDALQKAMKSAVIDAPKVVAIADPFNGYLRGLPATPFLAPVLAACGLPAYMHGLEAVGPKYGVTAHQVLRTAGKRVDLDSDQAAQCLDDPQIGWCYIDQSSYLPGLHDLVELRDIMVKRSFISTLEVVLKPLSGSQSTCLLTWFVHKAYPPVYAALASHAGYDAAAVVRGVEGGCIPSLSQVSRYFGYRNDGDLSLYKLSPKTCGIDRDVRAVPVPGQYGELLEKASFGKASQLQPLVEELVRQGLAALDGEPGEMLDSLIYGGAIALSHFTGVDVADAASKVRDVIANGHARTRFEAGL